MFVPSHQMVSLDVDMERHAIRGVTELSIEPTSSLLDKIRLHCSRPVVHKVSIDGHPCTFVRHGPQTRRQLIQKIQQQRKNYTEGDLEIIIPTDQVQIEPVGESSYRQLKVRIEFYLVAPTSGVVFNESTVHTETRALEPNSTASTWLPCVDTRHDRPTWDLFYSVPACAGSAETQLLPLTVVSSGELSSLIVHPRDPARRMFRYTMLTPTPACMLGWAIGPFTSACSLDSSLLGVGNPNGESEQEVPDEREEDDAEETEQKANGEEGEEAEEAEEAKASHNAKLNKSTVDAIGGVFAFTYGGHQDELENTCAFIPEALAFHSQEFGAYPYTTYKTVFMDGLQQPVVTCAALTLLSTDFLHPANIIEQVYETRRCLGLAIAHQWFGTYIVEETWSDHWLVAGLAGFTASLFVKHNLGVNEHRYRLKRDMARLCHADVNQKPISYVSQKDTVATKEDREFISLKAPIVLHMLDRRMIKGGHSLGMHRIIGKLLVAAMSGELGASNAVGTAWFLKLCRKISNGSVDIREFADQWIKGSGCPVFHLGYAFNRKRLAVEITLHQESTNAKATAPWVKPTKLFRGQITARIREADGTPYEHVLEIHERWKKFDVQFNTKYKRIRRSTKRFHLRQMAAAAEELNVNTEVLGLEDDGETYSNIALFGAENEQEKNDWRVVEWGEDDDESLASATFEWIRIDPDLEWACVLHFEQPDFMWAAQLHRDRDVAAQLEAVDALRHLKSAAASTTLMRTVMDARVFYRVRVDAALALESYATRELDWIGLHHLVKIYKRRYCLPPPSASSSMNTDNESAEGGEGLGDSEDILAPRLPQPNNFASIGEYFTQKAVLAALSNVRDRYGEAPRAARQLLLGALQCNDNSENVYSDSYFISMLVRALTNTVIASKRVPSMEVLREVERLRRSDLLVPSFHNVVTRACLDSLTRVSVVQPQEHLFNTAMFCSMAIAPECLPAVRESAVAGLLLHWGTPNLLSLALASDTSCPELAASTSRNVMQLAMIRALLHGQQHNSLLLMGQQSADEHIDRDVRLVGGMEALIDTLEEDGQDRFKTILASSIYDSGDANQHQLWLRVMYMLFYQTFDCSVPPPLPPAKKKLKIKLGKKKQPQSHGHRGSTASEDTPLALSMPPRGGIVDPYSLDLGTGDDYHEPLESAEIPLASTIGNYGLPAIAGTRPPAIVTKTSATEESTGAPKLKLKFKLGGAGGGSSTTTGASTPQPLTAATRKELPVGVPNTPEVFVGHKATAEDPLAMIRTGKSLGSIPKLPAETAKLLQKLLRKLCRLQGALPFLRPVDIMLDGCPTYYQVIKEPMDMGTMRRKLQKGLYENVDQFNDDMKKVFANCYKFNPPGTPVYLMGQSVEEAFDKEWPKFLEENKKLSAQQSKRKSAGADGKEEDGASKKKKKTKPKKPAAVQMAGNKGSKLARPVVMDNTQGSPVPSTSSSGVLKLKLTTSKSQVQSPVATAEITTAAPDPSGNANDPVLFSEPAPPKPKSRDWVSMCRRVLLRLQAQPSALEFLAPVDPVRQGVPTYFDIVKQPMDLSSARKKLDRKQYKSPNEVKQDLQLIFSNCMLFNTPGTFVHNQCLALQEIFAKCWRQQTGGKEPDEDVDPESLLDDLEMTDKAVERARGVVSKLKREAFCWPFLKPVDPVALGVPTYFDLVKNPMDLSTIQKKLSRKKYQNVADFVADIQLILDDCFLFNIVDTPVHECGKAMEKEAKELLKQDGWDKWLA